jgi:hypothetical protein
MRSGTKLRINDKSGFLSPYLSFFSPWGYFLGGKIPSIETYVITPTLPPSHFNPLHSPPNSITTSIFHSLYRRPPLSSTLSPFLSLYLSTPPSLYLPPSSQTQYHSLSASYSLPIFLSPSLPLSLFSLSLSYIYPSPLSLPPSSHSLSTPSLCIPLPPSLLHTQALFVQPPSNSFSSPLSH